MRCKSLHHMMLATALKTCGIVIATMTSAGLASASEACNIESAIVKWLESPKACPSADYTAVVLAYSHTEHNWTAARYECVNGSFTGSQDKVPLEIAVGNAAAVKIRSGDDIRVLVTETNPLLYTAEQTTASEADTPDVAELQGFLSLLGGTIGQIAAAPKEFDRAVPAKPADARLLAADPTTNPQLRPPHDKRAPDEFPSDVADAINKFASVVRARVAAIANQATELNNASDQLANLVDDIEAAAGRIRLAVQKLEVDETPNADWDKIGIDDLLGSTSSRVAELRRAAREVTTSSTACTAPFRWPSSPRWSASH